MRVIENWVEKRNVLLPPLLRILEVFSLLIGLQEQIAFPRVEEQVK